MLPNYYTLNSELYRARPNDLSDDVMNKIKKAENKTNFLWVTQPMFVLG